MRSRLPIVLLAICAGCDGTESSAPPGSLGFVAVAGADTGALVIIDVATAEARPLLVDGPPYGALSLSPSGDYLAFARDSQLVLDREVFAADTATGEVRNIAPSTGEFSPWFQWLGSDWFWYAFQSGTASHTAIAGPGEADARIIGTLTFTRVDSSPTDARIAYIDCVARVMGRCSYDVVVEELDGSSRTVVVSGVLASTPRFSPDGSSLLYGENIGGETRLLSAPLAGGTAADLGRMQDTWFLDYDLVAGGSRFSPDGSEILAHRDDQLLAVRLDGSGERVITGAWAERAAFTGAGDVVYEVAVNIEDPPDDTPVYEYSSFVVDTSGDSSPLREHDPRCQLSIVSPSGRYVGYDWCPGGAVHRIDGSHVVDTSGDNLVGFDRSELGVVATTSQQVDFVPLDGGSPRVLAAFTWTSNDAEWPPLDYAP